MQPRTFASCKGLHKISHLNQCNKMLITYSSEPLLRLGYETPSVWIWHTKGGAEIRQLYWIISLDNDCKKKNDGIWFQSLENVFQKLSLNYYSFFIG